MDQRIRWGSPENTFQRMKAKRGVGKLSISQLILTYCKDCWRRTVESREKATRSSLKNLIYAYINRSLMRSWWDEMWLMMTMLYSLVKRKGAHTYTEWNACSRIESQILTSIQPSLTQKLPNSLSFSADEDSRVKGFTSVSILIEFSLEPKLPLALANNSSYNLLLRPLDLKVVCGLMISNDKTIR